MEEDIKQISDYTLGELQDKIEDLYVLYQSSKDKSDRKSIKKDYAELTNYYNKVVGKKIYIEHL